MPTLTLETAQTNLAKWIAADAALADGKMFSMNGRNLTRADAEEVRSQIEYWSRIEARLEHEQAKPNTRGRRTTHSRISFSG